MKTRLTSQQTGVTSMKYIYTFTDAKRIDSKAEHMANVVVSTLTGKEIGKYSWSRLWDRFKEKEINNMVNILIREYELRIAFNKKGFFPEPFL